MDYTVVVFIVLNVIIYLGSKRIYVEWYHSLENITI